MLHHDKSRALLKSAELLAQIESTGVNFLTCSIDTSCGQRQALNHFRNMAVIYRKTLSHNQLTDFDHAAKMVETYLQDQTLSVKGILFFSRGILGGQYFEAIPVHMRLDNRLFFSSAPIISTLLESIYDQRYRESMVHWNEAAYQSSIAMLQADVEISARISDIKTDGVNSPDERNNHLDLVA